MVGPIAETMAEWERSLERWDVQTALKLVDRYPS
jgi:hypothetical protein